MILQNSEMIETKEIPGLGGMAGTVGKVVAGIYGQAVGVDRSAQDFQ